MQLFKIERDVTSGVHSAPALAYLTIGNLQIPLVFPGGPARRTVYANKTDVEISEDNVQ